MGRRGRPDRGAHLPLGAEGRRGLAPATNRSQPPHKAAASRRVGRPPGASYLPLELVPLPAYLATLESLLDATRRAGLAIGPATTLGQHAVQTVVTMVENEPPPATDVPKHLEPAAAARYDRLRRLPDEFANVRAAAGPLAAFTDTGDYYALGISMIVGGIRGVAEREA